MAPSVDLGRCHRIFNSYQNGSFYPVICLARGSTVCSQSKTRVVTIRGITVGADSWPLPSSLVGVQTHGYHPSGREGWRLDCRCARACRALGVVDVSGPIDPVPLSDAILISTPPPPFPARSVRSSGDALQGSDETRRRTWRFYFKCRRRQRTRGAVRRG